MTTDARRLDVYLSLKDGFSQNIAKSERGLDRFRTSLRRASITLGAFGAAGSLAIRSWVAQAETTRQSVLQLAFTLDTLGENASAMGPRLEAMFAGLSKESGASINSIRNTFVALTRAFGNGVGGEAFAERTLAAAVALERLTGTKDAANLLAKALAGNEDAIEEFRTLTNIDLSTASSTAERLAMAVAGLVPHLAEGKGSLDDITNSAVNLKDKMGESFEKLVSKPLAMLADVMDRFAENEALVTFAATFTAMGTAFGLLGASLVGILWLTSSHPLVLALIAISVAIAGIVAGVEALNTLEAAKGAARAGAAGMFGANLPASPSGPEGSDDRFLVNSILQKIIENKGSVDFISDRDLDTWTSLITRNPARFPALRELLARIRRARVAGNTKEGGIPGDGTGGLPRYNDPIPGTEGSPGYVPPNEGPGDFPPQWGGGGATDRGGGVTVTNYNITNYGDLDMQRRLIQQMDDAARLGGLT